MNPVYPRQLVMMRIGVRKACANTPAPIRHMAERIACHEAERTGSTLHGWQAATRFANAATRNPFEPRPAA